MPSREDLARVQESAASAARAQLENQANKLVAEAQINLINQAITALPAPVNAGARALGEGIYAAFKTPVAAVSNPRPNEDPVKLLAFAIAFAILKAIWCFIKSLLNPLPIIGSFFPLCSNDPQITGATDSRDTATTNARSAAENDPSNTAATNAENTFNRVAGAQYAADQAVIARNTIAEQTGRNAGAAVPATVSAQSSEMSSGAEGITFEEYVRRTVAISSVPTVEGGGPSEALRGQTNQNQTSANVPVQPPAEPQWQPTDKLTEGVSYEAYRRLFGL